MHEVISPCDGRLQSSRRRIHVELKLQMTLSLIEQTVFMVNWDELQGSNEEASTMII